MKILTFDTSLNKTYITYGENNKIIISKAISSDNEKYHSAYLVPEIINLLKSEKITLKDIDVIGINEGPGSFTGIRICTVIARTAAQQLDIKVVPVPSLEILSKINKSDKKTLTVLDARKNKVYIAAYAKNETLIEPKAIQIEELENLIKSDDYVVISDNSIFNFLQSKGIDSINYELNNYELGEFLYHTVLQKLDENNDYHWAKAKPLYIQPPSISTPKKAGV